MANTTDFNFGTWAYWAKNLSKNKNVKIFLGAPAAPRAGAGYVSGSSLASLATSLRKKYSSFGGVMYWDASQAYANTRFDLTIKNALTVAGGTGFTYPPCSATAYVLGQSYSGGTQTRKDSIRGTDMTNNPGAQVRYAGQVILTLDAVVIVTAVPDSSGRRSGGQATRPIQTLLIRAFFREKCGETVVNQSAGETGSQSLNVTSIQPLLH